MSRNPLAPAHSAASCGGDTLLREYRFGDVGRDRVRALSLDAALDLLWGALDAGEKDSEASGHQGGCKEAPQG